MQIREDYGSLEQSIDYSAYQICRDGSEKKDVSLITEHLMDVYINEMLVMKLVCTPQNLAELVLGRMLSEGIIKDVSEIGYIYVCEYGSRARVMLNRQQKETGQSSYVETTQTCCTGNRLLSDYFVSYHDVGPVDPIDWKVDWIWKFIDLFEQDMPLHYQTSSTHSCFLMLDGEIVFQCEDIGRHNALDKGIGYALRQGMNLRRCAVYTSGRMPTDMVTKVIRAGIPILVSKETPTWEAIELAKKYRLTLIGKAKKGRMFLYAGEPAGDMV